jgi:hypothetical protein
MEHGQEHRAFARRWRRWNCSASMAAKISPR